MRALYVLPLVLLTTACASPTWLPAGYSWHNEEYKAQPGPVAKDIGYPYTADRNEYINGMWSDTARALVDELEAKTGLSAQTVYVEKLPAANAFNLSLDNALRTELTRRGYMLADIVSGNTVIKYQAFEAEKETGNKAVRPVSHYNGDEETQAKQGSGPESARAIPFVFVLTTFKKGVQTGEIHSTQIMPPFGYVSGQGGDPARASAPKPAAAAPVAQDNAHAAPSLPGESVTVPPVKEEPINLQPIDESSLPPTSQ